MPTRGSLHADNRYLLHNDEVVNVVAPAHSMFHKEKIVALIIRVCPGVMVHHSRSGLGSQPPPGQQGFCHRALE